MEFEHRRLFFDDDASTTAGSEGNPGCLRCMDLSCTHGSDFIAAVPNAPYKLHACCLQGRLHIINPVGTDRTKSNA